MSHDYEQRISALENRIAEHETRITELENAPAPEPEPEPEPSPEPSPEMTQLETDIFNRVNLERASRGIPELQSYFPVVEVSRAHSENMRSQNNLSHTLDGKDAGDRLTDAGITYTGWGENIAYGYDTADEVMDAWMGSQGHRDNILNPDRNALGVGVAAADTDTPWYTQTFVTTSEVPSPEPEPTPDPEPTNKTLVGATVGWVSGLSQNQATQQFIDFTGRPLPVRRVFDGPKSTASGIPSSFNGSQLRHDNGTRAQVWSFKPSSSVTQSDVEALFASIPDRSRVYVTPYHEPRDNMSASEYLRRYRIVRAAYDAVGGFAGMGPILTNWGTYAASELDYVDSTGVDFVGIDPYGDPGYEDNLSQPITASASTAIDFCNQRGIPLNVGEFGVDTSRASNAAQQAWVESFKDLPSVVRVDWICYWHDQVGDFDCRLNSTSVPWYRSVYDAVTGA